MTDALSFDCQTRGSASALLCPPAPCPGPPSTHHLPPSPLQAAARQQAPQRCEAPGRRPLTALRPSPPHLLLVFSVFASLTHCPQQSRERRTAGLLRLLSKGARLAGTLGPSAASGGPSARPTARTRYGAPRSRARLLPRRFACCGFAGTGFLPANCVRPLPRQHLLTLCLWVSFQ